MNKKEKEKEEIKQFLEKQEERKTQKLRRADIFPLS